MAFKQEDEIRWVQNGEVGAGTDTSTVPDGNLNEPIKDVWDNTLDNKNRIDGHDTDITSLQSDVSTLQSNVSAIPTAHNDLSGINGGDGTGGTNNFHLTSAQYLDLTGTTQASQDVLISGNASQITTLDSRVTALETKAVEKVLFYDAALINATSVAGDNLTGQTINIPDTSTVGSYASFNALVVGEDIDVFEMYSQDFGNVKIYVQDLNTLNPTSGSPWIVSFDDDFSNDHKLDIYFDSGNLVIRSQDIAGPGGGDNSQYKIYRVMGYSVNVVS